MHIVSHTGHAAAILIAIGLPLLGAAPAQLSAQQDSTTVSVTGVVGDAWTGAPLDGAIVTIPELGIRTLTDPSGRFVLFGIPRGEHTWLFRMPGYADWEQAMEVEDLERLRVGLLPQPVSLESITVTTERLAQRRKAVGLSVQALSWKDINSAVAANAAEVIVRRSPSPAVGCPGQGSLTRPTPSSHPARSAPTVTRAPLGGANASVGLCIRWRGQIISPAIYLDEELIAVPLDVLHAYAPHEIHSIEFFSGGSHVRVYTVAFIQSGKPLLPTGLLFR